MYIILTYIFHKKIIKYALHLILIDINLFLNYDVFFLYKLECVIHF